MNKTMIIKEMMQIVADVMTAYQSDIVYDIDYIYTHDADAYVWVVRSTGTHIESLETFTRDCMTYHAIDLSTGCFLIHDNLVVEKSRDELREMVK